MRGERKKKQKARGFFEKERKTRTNRERGLWLREQNRKWANGLKSIRERESQLTTIKQIYQRVEIKKFNWKYRNNTIYNFFIGDKQN